MRPIDVALVWLVAAAHFAFMVYLPSGGFLAWRWRRGIWLHPPAVLWGLASVAVGLRCPLTDLEQWARTRADMAPLGSTGFIDHYLTGVLYPGWATGYVQTAVALAVLVSWLGYGLTARRGIGHRRTVANTV